MDDSAVIGLEIPAVTEQHIRPDIWSCLAQDGKKQKKRLARLGLVERMAEEEGEEPSPELVLPPPEDTEITAEQVRAFLRTGAGFDNEPALYWQDPDGECNDAVKKAIEAELTSAVNRDLLFHRITSRAMMGIWQRLSRDKVLGPLIESRDVILVFKGSVVQRTVLTQRYPAYTDEIAENFKYGGDNDCCVYINPHLADFDAVQDRLKQLMHQQLIKAAKSLAWGAIGTRVKEITTITVAGVKLNVEPYVRRSFDIKRTGQVGHRRGRRVDEISKETHGTPSMLYVTYNDTLKFLDPLKQIIHFALQRIRIAFRVWNDESSYFGVVVGSEFLDVAIVYNDDSKTLDHFHGFQTGKYVRNILV